MPRPEDKRTLEALRLVAAGRSIKGAAERVGICRSTLQRALARRGVDGVANPRKAL